MPKPASSLLIVPDTNVIVSGAAFPQSWPGLVMQAWRRGKVRFVLCEPILSEVIDVLARPYFARRYAWSAESIRAYVDDLCKGSSMVTASIPVQISPDPDDDMLFSCALAGGAQYIVSGNEKHVLLIPEYRGVKTMRPREFVGQVLEQTKVA